MGPKDVLWVKPRAPWLKIRTGTALEERMAALYVYWNIINLGYWGNAKGACAPEVRDLMNDPNPEIRRFATTVHAATIGWDLY